MRERAISGWCMIIVSFLCQVAWSRVLTRSQLDLSEGELDAVASNLLGTTIDFR